MLTLRPYQTELISNIRSELLKGHQRVVCQSPTGSGKTVIFSFIVKSAAEKGNRCLIVTDRIELLSQTGGTFEKIGLPFSLLVAGDKRVPSNHVTVGMVETLKRRLKTRLDFQMWFKRLDLIIIDECHKNTFNEIFTYMNPACIVLGFSATPIRFGNMPELGDFFTSLVNGPGIGNLISENHLARPKYFGVPVDLSSVRIKAGEFEETDLQKIYTSSEVFGGLAENLDKHGKAMKTIIFCPTIETSKQVAAELKCLHVDGTMSKEERGNVLKTFESDPHGMISNVGILTTGYDHPPAQRGVIYRATKSLPLFLQICGRLSRYLETKKDFMILDFGNNILRHNFWHVDRTWQLENDKKKKVRADREDIFPIKDCPNCGALVPVNVKECSECGYIWTKTEQEKRFAELQEMEYGHLMKKIRQGMSIEEMEEIRVTRGYKIGWLLRQFKTLDDFKAYGKMKKYHWKWAEIQWERFSSKE